MKSMILDEQFKPAMFRVVDHQRNVVEDSVDANDIEKLKSLSEKTEGGTLILEIACGNPERCQKGWHTAMLFFEDTLWVQVETVHGSVATHTMIGIGRQN